MKTTSKDKIYQRNLTCKINYKEALIAEVEHLLPPTISSALSSKSMVLATQTFIYTLKNQTKTRMTNQI